MKAQVTNVIHRFGEPVVYEYRDGTGTFSFMASVQRPVSENLVGDFDTYWFVIYIAIEDLPKIPVKFDRITVRSSLRSVDEVTTEVLKGEDICYVVRIRG